MGRTEATFRIGGRELTLSNLDKVLYPETGFTKGQVIDYYVNIAPVLLPHLKDRPLTLKRYPNGVHSEYFYEKRAPRHRPDWIKTTRVHSSSEKGNIDFCLVNDLPSLVWAANLADLELHPFLAKKKDVERPTQIMVDLDPGAPADATDCAQVAIWIRDLLKNLGLKCWVKSSGSKGLQLHIPLNTPTSYEITKPFAHALAEALRDAHPDRVVSDMKKTLRAGKVLIDWSQNDASKTTICAYSLRAKARPFVAAPLDWKEVEACLKKDDPEGVFFDSDEVLKRVKKRGDLFEPVLKLKQKLPKKILQALPEAAEKSAAARSVPRTSRHVARERRTKSAAQSGHAGLSRYNAKRDFQQTREPAGKLDKKPSKAALFVIQKHDASHLHYDFRLAMGGALKSWAVPKTIPTKKGEKHLAVEVEDHPMDYARFEGIIPPGNYGGGTVMVWDIGTYRMLGGKPLQAWREGLLHFELKGKKLKGEWSLIRTRQQGGKNQWLLLKSGADVKPISAKQDDASALTKRTMVQIARQKKATWISNRDDKSKSHPGPPGDEAEAEAPAKEEDSAAAKPLPSAHGSALLRRFVEPMKCLPVKEIPEGAAWSYELKFDGYRALAICRRSEVELVSRNRKSFNARFPAIVEAVAELPVRDAILDGEIVALNADGHPSFQALQNYESGPLAYYLFDLLALDGEDWTGRPLHERKARLQKLLHGVPAPILFSADLNGEPETIWRQIRAQRLEGLVAKRRDSVYEPGRRSGAWAKIKAINQQEFVIGGYTAPRGSRRHFGALLIGVHQDDELRFCAKVGTGFDRAGLAALEKRMAPLRVKECPFANLPAPRKTRWGGGVTASDMKSCTWIEPKLVCEVEFTEWTGENSLRHPAFIGLREDVPASAVHRERAAAAVVD
jgi:bifunctional non-homologous end joining protein LigD